MKSDKDMANQPYYAQYDQQHPLQNNGPPQNPHHQGPIAATIQGPHPEMLPSMRPYEGYLPQLPVYGVPPPKTLQPIQQEIPGSPAPAWAHAGPAERTRMRVNKACDRCRLHKIKCTGTYPCANCTKHGIECNFRTRTEEPLAKRPRSAAPDSPEQVEASNATSSTEDFATRALPILKTNNSLYTRYLENRVHYLENLLLENLTSTFKNVGQVNPDVQDINDLLKLTLSKWRFCRRHQNALVIELCKLLYEGLTPESKEQVLIPRTQYFGWNMLGCNYLRPEQLPVMPTLYDVLDESRKMYVDFFFREINPLYAIIHETVFREQFEAFDNLKAAEDVPDTNVTAIFSCMVCLVYALSIRFTEFMKPDGPSIAMLKLEETLFKYAHKVLMIFSFEWESFELIQNWLLVTLYLRITHRQTSANFAMGHAITMCRSMGLGRTTEVIADVKPYELLKAKRIFYSVYCFDRIIGLQGGRYRALNENDITRSFPSSDFEVESARDDWITLPAFAMIQISKIANFIHTSTSDNYDLIKAQQINKEIELLKNWLNRNGFDDALDIFPVNGANNGLSSMVKAQVKLHFYDLLIAVHGKLLFNYFGKRIASEGMKIEQVMVANEGIVFLLKKLRHAGCLFAPWYIDLLLLFNVGINCLIFINAGVFLPESRRLMKDTMSLLNTLQQSPVKNEAGKLIFRERFKMVRECIWAFKMTNHIMALSFKESLAQIDEMGIDHGSSDVNKQHFSQLGLEAPKRKDDLEKLMDDQNKRNYRERKSNNVKSSDTPTSLTSTTSQPNSDSISGDDLIGNLQWFDQWLDFNYDL